MSAFDFDAFRSARAAMSAEEKAAEARRLEVRDAEERAATIERDLMRQLEIRKRLLANAARLLENGWPTLKGTFPEESPAGRGECFAWCFKLPGVLVVSYKNSGHVVAVSEPGQPAVLAGTYELEPR